MKWLKDAFDQLRPSFEEGGKLESMKAVFDATENFFFAPDASATTAPHVRDPLDLKRYMSMVILALLPCTLAGIYFFGLRVLLVIAVSYAAGGAVEVLFAMARDEEITEGFLVTGLIFPLILPPGLPLWMVAMGVAFGVMVGKELFGGTGRNIFNPALLGRVFLALSYPAAMTKGTWFKPVAGGAGRLFEYVTSAQVDAVSAATPLGAAKQGNWAAVSDLLVGNVSGSIGETSALLVILGGVFLLATRVANWRTVVGVLGSFAAAGFLLQSSAPARFGPPGWHMLAGGLLFGTFFMATDPVTSPVTSGGKWAYGVLIGVVTLLIRNLTGYVEGVMFAILLGNIFAPILDEAVFRLRHRRLLHEA